MARWLTQPKKLWTDADSAELSRIDRLIERAEAIILQRFPVTAQRVVDGKLSTTVVAGVVEDMVNRAIASQDRGGIDRLSYPEVTLEWSDNGAGGGSLLYLTMDELLLLTPPEPQAVFSVRRKPRPS
ncbi:hypothetical protein [Corynebacterium ulcerans]|uniref:hypothetical protein n=1 Tax=Corynebacterium ulcerans TaxID=65058 RepID=UPI0002E877E8|nr:hypothetical protein [Corynebacterium ulcerans]